MSSILYNQLLQFSTPKLKHYTTGWVISYRVLNPSTGKMQQKQVRLNQLQQECSTNAEFKQRANLAVNALTDMLMKNWSPFNTKSSTRYFCPLFDALEKFMKEKEKELRPDSIRTYKGAINILKQWLVDNIPANNFSAEHALEFTDYLLVDRDICATTFNTYLKLYRVMFTWLQDNLYVEKNYFTKIKKKRPSDKVRDVIPLETRQQIAQWCKKHNPNFLLVCELIYYSLIRPMELSRLQVKHLQLDDNCIYLPSETTKCHCMRHAAISDYMKDRLATLVAGHAPDEYIFSYYFRPGIHAAGKKHYTKIWNRLRDDLNLPHKYQLYSLRDTGITEKLNSGITALNVMRAAGHHDLSETTKYLQRPDKSFIQTLIEQSPEFS